MKIMHGKVFVLVFCIVIGLIAGCQEQEAGSTKKCRLIAAENMQLTKDLAQRDKQIETLKKQHDEQVKKQAGQLATCQKEKEECKKKESENVGGQVNTMMSVIMEQTAQMHKENESLKAKVEDYEHKTKNIGGPMTLGDLIKYEK